MSVRPILTTVILKRVVLTRSEAIHVNAIQAFLGMVKNALISSSVTRVSIIAIQMPLVPIRSVASAVSVT